MRDLAQTHPFVSLVIGILYTGILCTILCTSLSSVEHPLTRRWYGILRVHNTFRLFIVYIVEYVLMPLSLFHWIDHRHSGRMHIKLVLYSRTFWGPPKLAIYGKRTQYPSCQCPSNCSRTPTVRRLRSPPRPFDRPVSLTTSRSDVRARL